MAGGFKKREDRTQTTSPASRPFSAPHLRALYPLPSFVLSHLRLFLPFSCPTIRRKEWTIPRRHTWTNITAPAVVDAAREHRSPHTLFAPADKC